MEMTLIDGCTVARRMRADFPSKDCLIVAVSRRADDVRRQQCIEAGIDLFLVKPVDSEVVETLLMLECARVNRSQADNAAALAAKGPSRFARKKSGQRRPYAGRAGGRGHGDRGGGPDRARSSGDLRAGRAPADVTLLAVSKTFNADAIAQAHASGITDFGAHAFELPPA